MSAVRRAVCVRAMLVRAGLLGLLWLLGGSLSTATAQTYTVAPELWDRPRSGDAVSRSAAVREAVARLIDRQHARLIVRHARDAEAVLHAEELRAWLAAYALEPARIELRADLAPKQPLVLEVTP